MGCRTKLKLELPDGTSAQDVIEKQAKVILAYEKRIEVCAAGGDPLVD